MLKMILYPGFLKCILAYNSRQADLKHFAEKQISNNNFSNSIWQIEQF